LREEEENMLTKKANGMCIFFIHKASKPELLMRGKLSYATEFEFKPEKISLLNREDSDKRLK